MKRNTLRILISKHTTPVAGWGSVTSSRRLAGSRNGVCTPVSISHPLPRCPRGPDSSCWVQVPCRMEAARTLRQTRCCWSCLCYTKAVASVDGRGRLWQRHRSLGLWNKALACPLPTTALHLESRSWLVAGPQGRQILDPGILGTCPAQHELDITATLVMHSSIARLGVQEA